MLNVNELWQKADKYPDTISTDELKLLLDDRLWYVTDNLHTISTNNSQEVLFDLLMLVVDSLQVHRKIVRQLLPKMYVSVDMLCGFKNQLLHAIDQWHEKLFLNWPIGKSQQHFLFLGILLYVVYLWTQDETVDSSHVMAKVDELVRGLSYAKTQLGIQ